MCIRDRPRLAQVAVAEASDELVAPVAQQRRLDAVAQFVLVEAPVEAVVGAKGAGGFGVGVVAVLAQQLGQQRHVVGHARADHGADAVVGGVHAAEHRRHARDGHRVGADEMGEEDAPLGQGVQPRRLGAAVGVEDAVGPQTVDDDQ